MMIPIEALLGRNAAFCETRAGRIRIRDPAGR